ncbi:lateral signaling target protein 2 homolog isoform X2 [Latimeria chalumnae]|uniref:lateral signaling target protein 2 homolog isoform X2 n=1 Tax=Latimeria chalumnae TaxID=7897 RepID=UPI0006D90231|nr:PREDICTED: lateral signaling target protein 2 homolog isoform X2 [Latimeria chalumnae]|eukprot:XP_014341818.1 PREDICTED: lateral signaling target protein 2 homolog isoform X2 [Latimeria chalumnae]
MLPALMRRWLCRPKKSDPRPLAQFYYADKEVTQITTGMSCVDMEKEPQKYLVLLNQLHLSQSLSAGSFGEIQETEGMQLCPLAEEFLRSLEDVRNLLREQSMTDNCIYIDDIRDALIQYDRVFAEFELSYISSVVPVKSEEELHKEQEIVVLFCETVDRALKLRYLTQEMIDEYEPLLMFTIPRLAIMCGLLIYPDGPLNLQQRPEEMSKLFRPFYTLLHKIRDLLYVLTPEEQYILEKSLCSAESGCLSQNSTASNMTSRKICTKPLVESKENIVVETPSTIQYGHHHQQQSTVTCQTPCRMSTCTPITTAICSLSNCTEMHRNETVNSSECFAVTPQQWHTDHHLSTTVEQCGEMKRDRTGLVIPNTNSIYEGTRGSTGIKNSCQSKYEHVDTPCREIVTRISYCNTIGEQGWSHQIAVSASKSSADHEAYYNSCSSKSEQKEPQSLNTVEEHRPESSSFQRQCIKLNTGEQHKYSTDSTSSLIESSATQERIIQRDTEYKNTDEIAPNFYEKTATAATVFQQAFGNNCRSWEQAHGFNAFCDPRLRKQTVQQVREAIKAEIRSRYRSRSDMIHRLFVCISGVADQLQTNFASDLRSILKTVFVIIASKSEILEEHVDSYEEDVEFELPETRLQDCVLCQELYAQASSTEDPNIRRSEGPPEWIPDGACSECMSCKTPFTLVRRRHHCRNCGRIFCSRCSSHMAPLPWYGQMKPVRVCTHCYNIHVCPFLEDTATI